jgi:hypothetical protein
MGDLFQVKSNFLFLFALICFAPVFAISAVARTEAPTPPMPGPLAVQTAEYKFPAVIDPDVLAGAATEIWGRAYWPTDLTKPRPIVFLLHGNHSTCRYNNTDLGCGYTSEGACQTGETVVLNHEGYNYLGQQLASLGYIVVSINANRGITCGNGNDADWGLNLARGKLVLRHIEQWNTWTTKGGAPASLGISPDAFVGKVDLTNVGLMGHSRGGEGMRAAAAIYRDAGSIWPARIPNLKIRGIFEIGSVDGQSGRVLDADDMAWNQLLPMCDGDVNDLEGRYPFERMLQKQSEARKTPKSLTMVWGTNHNFYNTQWRTDESLNCLEHKEVHGPGPTSDNQQKIAATELSAFMLANVGADRDPKMGELFDPAFNVPSSLTAITRIDRDHVPTYDRAFDVTVDDFEQASGISSNRKANESIGVTVKNTSAERPSRAEVAWNSAGSDHYVQMNWTDPDQGRDVSAFTSLDLRVGRPIDQIHQPQADFSVALVDAKGIVSTSILVSKYADLTGPGSAVDLYQTVRIPLEDFVLPAGFQVRGVRITFDKSPMGELNFANIRFSSNQQAAFAASLNLPLTPSTPIATPAATLNNATALPAFGSTNPPAPVPTKSTVPATPTVTGPTFGFDPYASVSPKVLFQSARLIGTHNVTFSKYLSGRSGIEIAVGSDQGIFPAEAQLPTLVMEGAKFSVSRYAPTGQQNTLIFSVPRKDFTQLPSSGAMWVQYGRSNARKVSSLPNYVKSELDR